MLLRRSIVGTFARCITQPPRSGLMPTGGVLARQKSILPATSLTVQPLVDRSFIRVHGADSGSFLQGLMTNDIRHFAHCEAIYAMFLKANGRVFCDTLIYKQSGKEVADDFLLECDSSVAPQLEKHLRMYRLKKKVEVMSDESFRLWVAFRNGAEDEEGTTSEETTVAATGGQLELFKDPRLARLGYRVLSSKSDQPADTMEQLHHMFPGASIASADGGPLPYTPFRYSLGVGEGTENLPDGKCFPLECNCDYLHGVSFHKGCYIGQELTARTYHTGVIRKRLMPLEFDAPPALNVPPEMLRDAEIKNPDGAVVGKLRGLAGSFGLALLRIEKVPPGGELSLNVAGVSDHIVCRTRKPFWWPKETNTRH